MFKALAKTIMKQSQNENQNWTKVFISDTKVTQLVSVDHSCTWRQIWSENSEPVVSQVAGWAESIDWWVCLIFLNDMEPSVMLWVTTVLTAMASQNENEHTYSKNPVIPPESFSSWTEITFDFAVKNNVNLLFNALLIDFYHYDEKKVLGEILDMLTVVSVPVIKLCRSLILIYLFDSGVLEQANI